jgi:hypothetical protein
MRPSPMALLVQLSLLNRLLITCVLSIGGIIGRGTQIAWRITGPVPLCRPQITHGLPWDWTRISASTSRPQTAWAVEWSPIPVAGISKIQEPLLSNGFTSKHVPTATVELQQWGTVFSVRSVPRCYKRDRLGEEAMKKEVSNLRQ